MATRAIDDYRLTSPARNALTQYLLSQPTAGSSISDAFGTINKAVTDQTALTTAKTEDNQKKQIEMITKGYVPAGVNDTDTIDVPGLGKYKKAPFDWNEALKSNPFLGGMVGGQTNQTMNFKVGKDVYALPMDSAKIKAFMKKYPTALIQ